jgi:serine/threonine protein phosphatase PrpC
MTANWRRKRRIRVRMAKTGESYTAALRHLRRAEEAQMSNYHLIHGGVTATGNVRTTNQDQLLAEGDLVAVADGMGGHRAGEVASRLAVDVLRDAFTADPTAEGLVAAVHAANRAVWEQATADPALHGMGTTLVAVALVGASLAVVNVGDSRAYLLQDGRLRRLTSDHSLVAELVRSGAISEDEARTHPRRNILTRVVGASAEIEPYVGEAVPERGGRLLLCSDGLFNELDEPQIAAILTQVADPTDAATRLVDEAKHAGGADNITALVLDIA